MVHRVAGQAAKVRLDVCLADLRFVAVPAAGKDDFWLDPAITLNEFWIARVCVLNSGAVAALAALLRRVRAFQSLRVRRLGKRLVEIFVTTLADLNSRVLRVRLRRLGILGKRPFTCNYQTQNKQRGHGIT